MHVVSQSIVAVYPFTLAHAVLLSTVLRGLKRELQYIASWELGTASDRLGIPNVAAQIAMQGFPNMAMMIHRCSLSTTTTSRSRACIASSSTP